MTSVESESTDHTASCHFVVPELDTRSCAAASLDPSKPDEAVENEVLAGLVESDFPNGAFEMYSTGAAETVSEQAGPEVRTATVKQGMWSRLKHAEKQWRVNKDDTRESDPGLSRCFHKVFEYLDVQCVMLRGRLHEQVLRDLVGDELHLLAAIIEEDLQRITGVMERMVEDFGCMLSMPISLNTAGTSDVGSADDVKLTEYVGQDPPKATKSVIRARKRFLKLESDFRKTRTNLAKVSPELAHCLELIYRQIAKVGMRLKYRLHLVVTRRGADGNTAALEYHIDAVIGRLTALVAAATAPEEAAAAAAEAWPPEAEEDEDCENYLFRAARLDELVARLDALE